MTDGFHNGSPYGWHRKPTYEELDKLFFQVKDNWRKDSEAKNAEIKALKEKKPDFSVFVALAEKWRRKAEKGNHPTDREVGWIECAGELLATVREQEAKMH